jgi:signal peptidase I
MSKYSSVFEVLRVTAMVFISAVIIRYFLFQPFIVEGSSMEPNYHNSEYLFVEKVSYRFREPKRGEVVVFRYPNNPRVNYIKRIIGVPGDTIRIENGIVYLNGTELVEEYLEEGTKTIVNRSPDLPYEVTVPKNKYFVMGDNRDHSSDSRDGWLVDRRMIIGRSAATLYSSSSSRSPVSSRSEVCCWIQSNI